MRRHEGDPDDSVRLGGVGDPGVDALSSAPSSGAARATFPTGRVWSAATSSSGRLRGRVRCFMRLLAWHEADVSSANGPVVSEPGLSFRVLCASVRHGTVRRTTIGQVREAGGSLMPSHGSDAPSYHCDLVGLTAAAFDAILSREEQNPIPAPERWRGLS